MHRRLKSRLRSLRADRPPTGTVGGTPFRRDFHRQPIGLRNVPSQLFFLPRLHIPATPATLRGAMTSIGVVIVSFNTCELLRGCLESLRGCALPLRVVVVENASHDDSAAMVRACFPEAELLALERNAGFTAGTNIGVRYLLDTETGRQGDGEPELLP